MRRSRLTSAFTLVAVTSSLSGCAATVSPQEDDGVDQALPSAETLYEEGFDHFSAVLHEMATVQLMFSDAPWEVFRYGAAPVATTCESGDAGYSFHVDRAVTDLDYDVSAAPEELIEQLRDDGWKAVALAAEELSVEDSAMRAVTASGSPGGTVRTLTTAFYEATHTVWLSARSECFVGDSDLLFSLVLPDESSLVVPIYPKTELPGAEPEFHFSLADGTARDTLAEAESEAQADTTG